jgi:hypothetical protein
MVMAKAAASARIAPAMKARIRVSFVDMKTFASPASIMLMTNSLGATYAIVGLLAAKPFPTICWPTPCPWDGGTLPSPVTSLGSNRKDNGPETAQLCRGSSGQRDGVQASFSVSVLEYFRRDALKHEMVPYQVA